MARRRPGLRERAPDRKLCLPHGQHCPSSQPDFSIADGGPKRFAAITDEPPPEIAAAGHDRSIAPIKEANVQAWLTSAPDRLMRFYEILDDRERPYYEHRMAA